MKKINLLCIAAIVAVSCFALSFTSQADELEDLYGNPEKSYYFVYATGAIQGSFGTMETCVYCHGNGGKGQVKAIKWAFQISQMQVGSLQKQTNSL
jgi:cytochrome c553